MQMHSMNLLKSQIFDQILPSDIMIYVLLQQIYGDFKISICFQKFIMLKYY